MENLNYASLFEGNPDIGLNERVRVLRELQEIGSLTFDLTVNKDGWMAECKEVEGIIAGGTNLNPSSAELASNIRDSIFAAFDVKTEVEEKSVMKDFKGSDFTFGFTKRDFRSPAMA